MYCLHLYVSPVCAQNCLPRAGASQFHGHAQTVVSREPCPTQVLLDRASEHYAAAHSGAEYLEDVVRAHRSIGLARRVSVGQSVAWLVASVCPYKDMEVFVTGSWLSEPAVAVLLHLALQALVGRLGMRTFNVGALNLGMPGALEPGGAAGGSAPVWVRLCSRGKLSVQASDFGGLEVFGGASIGHTDPFAVMAAIDAEAEALEVTLDQGGMLRHDLFGPGA